MPPLNWSKLFLGFILVVLLAGVRAFESTLFYDPFIAYYKAEYAHLPFPKMDVQQLVLNLSFRYAINAILTLVFIYVLFGKKGYVKVSALLLTIFGVLLLLSFMMVLSAWGEESKMTLFYIRRFLIQPLFLLLFIPAFLYQEKVK